MSIKDENCSGPGPCRLTYSNLSNKSFEPTFGMVSRKHSVLTPNPNTHKVYFHIQMIPPIFILSMGCVYEHPIANEEETHFVSPAAVSPDASSP
jgi:hypothetical protein